MGAWIETRTHQVETCRLHVAPYVGAWIETLFAIKRYEFPTVAPYVGAWIETETVLNNLDAYISRTLRGCVD